MNPYENEQYPLLYVLTRAVIDSQMASSTPAGQALLKRMPSGDPPPARSKGRGRRKAEQIAKTKPAPVKEPVPSVAVSDPTVTSDRPFGALTWGSYHGGDELTPTPEAVNVCEGRNGAATDVWFDVSGNERHLYYKPEEYPDYRDGKIKKRALSQPARVQPYVWTRQDWVHYKSKKPTWHKKDYSTQYPTLTADYRPGCTSEIDRDKQEYLQAMVHKPGVALDTVACAFAFVGCMNRERGSREMFGSNQEHRICLDETYDRLLWFVGNKRKPMRIVEGYSLKKGPHIGIITRQTNGRLKVLWNGEDVTSHKAHHNNVKPCKISGIGYKGRGYSGMDNDTFQFAIAQGEVSDEQAMQAFKVLNDKYKVV